MQAGNFSADTITANGFVGPVFQAQRASLATAQKYLFLVV
jgi:hypothetical protein